MRSAISADDLRRRSVDGSLEKFGDNPVKLYCQALENSIWEDVKNRFKRFHLNPSQKIDSIVTPENPNLERFREQIYRIVDRNSTRTWRKGDVFVCEASIGDSTKVVAFVVVRIDAGRPGSPIELLLSLKSVGLVNELNVAMHSNFNNDQNGTISNRNDESNSIRPFGIRVIRNLWRSLIYQIEEDNVIDGLSLETEQDFRSDQDKSLNDCQPFLLQLQMKMRSRACLVYPGMPVRVSDRIMGVITSCKGGGECLRKPSLTSKNVTITMDLEDPGEFERIHVSPFIDTVPQVYKLELYTECIKPYFSKHTLKRFREGDSFTSEAVQFKILAAKARQNKGNHTRRYRVGPSTEIYVGRAIYPHWIDILPTTQRDALQGMPRHTQTLALMRMIGDAPVADIERIMLSLEAVAGGRDCGVGRVHDSTNVTLQVDVTQYIVHRSQELFEADTTFCVVCLNDVSKDKDDIVRLPCKHIFHLKCVLHWFSRSVTCPLCKDNLMQNDKDSTDY